MRLAQKVVRGVVVLAAATVVAALVIVAFVLRDGIPDSTAARLGWAAVAIAAVVPAVVLTLFALLLRELIALPARLRAMPQALGGRAEEIGRLVGEIGGNEGNGARPRRPLPLNLWRLGTRIYSSRELLTPWAPLLPLASPPFLAAVVVSALVAPFEILVAAVLLVAAFF